MEEISGHVTGIIQIDTDVKNASHEKIEMFQNKIQKTLEDMLLFDIAESCGIDLDSYYPITVEEFDYEEYGDE